MDLIFPHHENEIAQSESTSDIPFARYWMHHGLLTVNQEKMSKSLGNIYTVQEMLERHEAAALRQYLLLSHYRSPIDFSEQGLEEAERGMERIYETIGRSDRVLASSNGGSGPEESLLDAFRREMDEDFNTPRALALVFEEVRGLNRMLDDGKIAGLAPRLLALKAMGEVLGLLQEEPEAFLQKKKERWIQRQGLALEAIEELIRSRERARSERKWQEADRIRNELGEKGITLGDTPEGTIWKIR